ncbi:YHS domain-containing protein [Sneathiella sp. P13V-1]|uniref:YHS domain-containing (seleno)protein n=1 Tax=Sneathiella sp. P13V-1 TaxID=2697366 RepID=UPI00187B58C9|nr:YHS domain-containing (seleno)protein [Sneathiella sp. P13V-1]MBE7635678.1 YHS domain-containing protein [Sneathiella sp. P13V-1]
MNKLSKRSLIAAIGLTMAAATVTLSSPSYAVVDNATSAVNTDEQFLAMQGYDPVAYFKSGGPQKGMKKFSVQHTGGNYYFASAENMKAFIANPEKYLPQYGGFCAMGTALGKKLDGDPNVWKIVDGKLYLNVNKDVSVAWNRNLNENIQTADDYWPELKHQTPASLNAN